MRALTGLLCAVAITACLAPGVRADEYTKQTFLTFSGPVQLPGITLPAGTYQFKLADPDEGRRTLQVWDKDGTKLYTTLLTIPDERMTPTDKPVVMFAETPGVIWTERPLARLKSTRRGSRLLTTPASSFPPWSTRALTAATFCAINCLSSKLCFSTAASFAS